MRNHIIIDFMVRDWKKRHKNERRLQRQKEHPKFGSWDPFSTLTCATWIIFLVKNFYCTFTRGGFMEVGLGWHPQFYSRGFFLILTGTRKFSSFLEIIKRGHIKWCQYRSYKGNNSSGTVAVLPLFFRILQNSISSSSLHLFLFLKFPKISILSHFSNYQSHI